MKPLLVKVSQAAEMLGVSRNRIYELSADGGPLERRYIGNRNFNVTYASLEEYVDSLDDQPTEEAS